MKALITGGCGFVGRHLVRRLSDDGHSVVVVDNMSTGQYRSEWLFQPKGGWSAVQFFQEDLRDFVRQGKPDQYDLIIHCAAIVGGRLKIDGDPLAVATDLAIDADFFNWIVRSTNKAQKVIYFSSSAVYPIELQTEATHCALHESLVDLHRYRIGMPDQTYGWAKLTGELLAQHAVKTYGTNVVIYRPFSGYGEDQSTDYPFPAIMQRVARREDPITIWGSGDQIRDFIYIGDIVDTVLATMNDLDSGATLNLGTGRRTSFRTLVEAACIQAGYMPEVICDTTKPQGVYARYSDSPAIDIKVNLPEGIRRVLRHFESLEVDKTKEPA